MKRQIAYWGENGVDVYDMTEDSKARLVHSGLSEGNKFGKSGMQQRILIVGSSYLIRLRKRYPLMKMDKLLRAIELEAPTLFPKPRCVYHCRIAERRASHIDMDIWAWEKEPAERLRTLFAFRYVIPEDLAFLSLPSGIHIYPGGSMIHVVACGEGRFMDAATFPVNDFSKDDLERFIMGLVGGVSFIRELRFYGSVSVDVPTTLLSCVKRIAGTDCPPFLEAIKGLPLKPFQWQAGEPRSFIRRTALLRFALYGVLAYGLMLFLTLHNYDNVLKGLDNQTRLLEKEIGSLEKGNDSGQDQETARDFAVAVRDAVPPLKVFDILAAALPAESQVKSLVLNNGAADILVSAVDPLAVLKQLGGNTHIGKISLKGSPVKEAATGLYNCALYLEIKP